MRLAVRRAVVVAWLVVLAATTSTRLPVWRTDLALWRDAVAAAPEKPRDVLNYGRALELAGDLAGANDAYRRVILLSFDLHRPAYIRRFSLAAAEVNLAHMAMKAGRFATAMRMLDSTLAAWPSFPYAHYNKGSIYWHVGACDEALQEFGLALAVDPTLPVPEGTCASARP